MADYRKLDSNGRPLPPPQRGTAAPQGARPPGGYVGGRSSAASGGRSTTPAGSRPSGGYVGGRSHAASRGGDLAYASGAPFRSGAAQKRKKRKRRTYLVIILVLALAILGLVVWQLVNAIENALQGNTVSGENVGHGTVNEDYNLIPGEYKDKNVLNILVCGLGYDGDEYYTDANNRIGPTDMIMYVRFNLKEGTVNALQIPRDTYIGNDYKTGGTRKINGLFMNAEDKNNRINSLVQVLYEQFKLAVDYYITLDLDSLKELVAVVHGLNVYVPYDVNNPQTGDVILEGWRRLDPEQVEFLARNRKSDSYNQQMDIMRMQTQQNIYTALFRLFKTLTPREMIGWGQILLKYVKTDIPVAKFPELMMSLIKVNSDQITFIRPAASPVSYKFEGMREKQSGISLDAVELADVLNVYFRSEGVDYSADELNVQELQGNLGTAETSIRVMASVEADAPPIPDDFIW